MCTVSFIPVNDRIYITSNRDEKLIRRKALPPQKYRIGDVDILFPKDGEAGGTWIGLCNNGNAGVLLNGGFRKHIPIPPYIKSRGLIFLEVLSARVPVDQFFKMPLSGIEPFTLVVFENSNLYECRWDGAEKYCKELLKSKSYIWSSVTLYDKAAIKKRALWFRKWLTTNPAPAWEDILNFHLFGGDGDTQNAFRMSRRNNQLLTVSITGIEIDTISARMKYCDLIGNSVHESIVDFLLAYPTE